MKLVQAQNLCPRPIHENLEQIADNAVAYCIWIILCRYRVSGASLVYALVLRLCPMALKMDAWCDERVGDNRICREEMRWLRVLRCILQASCLHGEIWQWRLCGPWMIFQHGKVHAVYCKLMSDSLFFRIFFFFLNNKRKKFCCEHDMRQMSVWKPKTYYTASVYPSVCLSVCMWRWNSEQTGSVISTAPLMTLGTLNL